ncbi:sugar kinase [Pokkaliibacter plantistimulans]|uniref:Sugar kinase n=1 Tax=Proteobacteria bacterium 228 TaxID=2083153 RepID=A0A2S5KV38_9PROT|nr:sugar kinase [Pokkaliibacter plantistimulans]PPC78731.1 sugar kinase [Pokkaliibacter plantistimulans]
MKKVLTIGEVLVEIVATTKGNGFLTEQPLVGPFPSGAPAIFIDQLGKLETPCAIVSRVGNDDFGQLNINRLIADGVDVSAIAIAEGECTASAFVRYQEDGNRAFIFNIKESACGTLDKTAEYDALVECCDHLHVMGSALFSPNTRALVMEAAARIKQRGGSVSFDPNIREEMLNEPGIRAALDDVVSLTDVFMPSVNELFMFTQSACEQDAVPELLQRGIGTIVLKRGADGASCFTRQGRWDAAPLAVTEIDPTGAGDSFGGAFLSFWLAGAAPEVALRYANAAGARAVTRLGPMEGTSNRQELDAFLHEMKG